MSKKLGFIHIIAHFITIVKGIYEKNPLCYFGLWLYIKYVVCAMFSLVCVLQCALSCVIIKKMKEAGRLFIVKQKTKKTVKNVCCALASVTLACAAFGACGTGGGGGTGGAAG